MNELPHTNENNSELKAPPTELDLQNAQREQILAYQALATAEQHPPITQPDPTPQAPTI